MLEVGIRLSSLSYGNGESRRPIAHQGIRPEYMLLIIQAEEYTRECIMVRSSDVGKAHSRVILNHTASILKGND